MEAPILQAGAAFDDQGETGGGDAFPHLYGREPVPIEVDTKIGAEPVATQGAVAVFEGRHQVSARL